jgi:hypothetical protein
MMKCKKHVVHPKSYPVPEQTGPASRNQQVSNPIQGGTLRTQGKCGGKVTRTAKSPFANYTKKPSDAPTQPLASTAAAKKQPIVVKPALAPKVLQPVMQKSLKKSLSNGDIHRAEGKTRGKSPTQQLSQQLSQQLGQPMVQPARDIQTQPPIKTQPQRQTAMQALTHAQSQAGVGVKKRQAHSPAQFCKPPSPQGKQGRTKASPLSNGQKAAETRPGAGLL